MNYRDIIIKKYNLENDKKDFEMSMKPNGTPIIENWKIGEKEPTIKELDTYYNTNKAEIDAYTTRQEIIANNKHRIINKLVEQELINEGLIE